MRAERVFNALNEVSDNYIEEASRVKLKKRPAFLRKWTAVATCLAALIGVGGAVLLQRLPFGGNTAPGESLGAGHNEGSVFMSYAGPVFPLTLQQEDTALSAARHIAYDFSFQGKGGYRVWGAGVEDGYTLKNPTAEEKTVTAIYPFSASYQDLTALMPEIAVDGAVLPPTLYAGAYAGSFRGMYGGNDTNGSHNLLEPNNWEDYKRLLTDGSYQRDAFTGTPALALPVTVYSFSGFTAPAEYEAATQEVSFWIDETKTTLLVYGFDGLTIGDDGLHKYNYFVPNGSDREKMLVVVGEDISGYTLQGYQDGSCKAGTELDGVSATVTRHEGNLADVIAEAAEDFIAEYLWQYEEGSVLRAPETMALFHGSVSGFLLSYGVLSDGMRDRYSGGRLEDLIQDALAVNRVFYAVFEVTIPAGRSLDIIARLHKNPSHDFHGTGSGNEGVQGYEMATRLSSNLHYDALDAELRATENIEIIRQNFGFDLQNGVTQVALDPSVAHYYIEVKGR